MFQCDPVCFVGNVSILDLALSGVKGFTHISNFVLKRLFHALNSLNVKFLYHIIIICYYSCLNCKYCRCTIFVTLYLVRPHLNESASKLDLLGKILH